MARSLNKVMLIGNLGKDPELRRTASGQAVATFPVATNRSWTGQDGAQNEETEWHNIVAWNRRRRAHLRHSSLDCQRRQTT